MQVAGAAPHAHVSVSVRVLGMSRCMFAEEIDRASERDVYPGVPPPPRRPDLLEERPGQSSKEARVPVCVMLSGVHNFEPYKL